ncbi:HAD-IA family hydrolase [Jeongeupia sp. USM3]|uniref:HAD-IA family hydrolase n=1 Tax=Jeongeupia sp. USM3 TaxID=1906741 RepID=UPI00214FC1F7|nr:HAD-IA family hydrolase [Jeongeupia sp. USM3]
MRRLHDRHRRPAAGGRPGPWMALENVIRLGISDVAACVKVDDTVPGIAEGLAAGMWTVGLSASGNEVGLKLRGMGGAKPARTGRAPRAGRAKLDAAGAHFVIDSIADLPAVIAEIDARLARGERP